MRSLILSYKGNQSIYTNNESMRDKGKFQKFLDWILIDLISIFTLHFLLISAQLSQNRLSQVTSQSKTFNFANNSRRNVKLVYLAFAQQNNLQ